MTELTTGSCLCGTVAFQVAGDFDRFFLCHCSRCRKVTGSAHAANLFSVTATLTWLAGEDRIKTFKVPGTRFEKSFCMDCGSALPVVRENGIGMMVPAGSLDSSLSIRPNAHIFCASRADWDDHLDLVQQVDGLPI
ncbi:GFA family protein [Pseudodonghicola xiamenensis]|uniref:Aldehyde-activating protein n=1 Tax=Pseudodonghicola xiamenensis TaxID=337702 RepID=A0A8J3H9P7_9RHOB|nr:GFA family protein [Pseudodonghicola xiamenensis]GHG94034.1 aldehyde-activating protein [Pseudodonghicola xiamenensis]